MDWFWSDILSDLWIIDRKVSIVTGYFAWGSKPRWWLYCALIHSHTLSSTLFKMPRELIRVKFCLILCCRNGWELVKVQLLSWFARGFTWETGTDIISLVSRFLRLRTWWRVFPYLRRRALVFTTWRLWAIGNVWAIPTLKLRSQRCRLCFNWTMFRLALSR